MQYSYEIKKAKDCSFKTISAFYKLAKNADQVDKIGLKNRIENCKLLAFCYKEEILVGISAIKNPNKNYKNKVFLKAKVEKHKHEFKFEIVYSFTKVEHRGRQICFNLNQQLVNTLEGENVYATSANPGMKRILEKIGFIKIGSSFKGEYNLGNIELFGLIKK